MRGRDSHGVRFGNPGSRRTRTWPKPTGDEAARAGRLSPNTRLNSEVDADESRTQSSASCTGTLVPESIQMGPLETQGQRSSGCIRAAISAATETCASMLNDQVVSDAATETPV